VRPDQNRGEDLEEELPPVSRRLASTTTRDQRSKSRDRRPQDVQRDVNEGTVNVLRIHSSQLHNHAGQVRKNNCYPFFDGTFKGYPKFCRRWFTFQNIYHSLTPHRELMHQFRENCMEKKVADWIWHEETMTGC
jgi:hypothetical protein